MSVGEVTSAHQRGPLIRALRNHRAWWAQAAACKAVVGQARVAEEVRIVSSWPVAHARDRIASTNNTSC